MLFSRSEVKEVWVGFEGEACFYLVFSRITSGFFETK